MAAQHHDPDRVRLGRPSNDNSRQPSVLVRLFVVALAAALALLAAAHWGLI